MAAITNPGTNATKLDSYSLVSFYDLAVASASETLTLTAKENGISEIQNVIVSINGGQDAAFTAVAASFSGLVVTITSVEQDGTASTAWTDTTVNVLVIGK